MVTPCSRNYQYDARDRLIGISGDLYAEFQYDVLGRRTFKHANGEDTSYRYDGDNVIEETTNGTTIRYLNGFGLDERYGRQVGEEPSVISLGDVPPYGSYLTDALGSTLALQDADGTWQAKYRYTPYGETQAQAFDANGSALSPGATADAALAELNNPYQYTGRENDGHGLYYYRVRYYDSKLGRFTQEDPLGFVDGPNPYAYVAGNPLQYNDPTGLFTLGEDGLPQWMVDGAAGWGDMLSFGLTNTIRSASGINGAVDHCSLAYKGGEALGAIHSLAIGGAGGARSAVKGWANFSHSMFPAKWATGAAKNRKWWLDNAFGKWLAGRGSNNRLNGDYVDWMLHARMDSQAYRWLNAADKARVGKPMYAWQAMLNRVPFIPGAALFSAGSAFVNNCECEK